MSVSPRQRAVPLKAALFGAVGCAGVLVSAAAAGACFESGADAGGAQDRAWSVEQREECRIVLREHTGPAWTLGRTLAEVNEYRAAFRDAGRVFVRHEHTYPPGGSSAPRLSVGFFVNRPAEVKEPYRLESRPGGTFLATRLEGPAWRANAEASALPDELRRRGLEPTGPVYELLGPDAAERREFEVSFRPIVPVEAPSGPAPAPAAPSSAAASNPTAGADPQNATRREELAAFMNYAATGVDSVEYPSWLLPSRELAVPACAEDQHIEASSAGRSYQDRRYADAAHELLPRRARLTREQRTWLAEVLFELDELTNRWGASSPSLAEELHQFRSAINERVTALGLDLSGWKGSGARTRGRTKAGPGEESGVFQAIEALGESSRIGATESADAHRCLAHIVALMEATLADRRESEGR